MIRTTSAGALLLVLVIGCATGRPPTRVSPAEPYMPEAECSVFDVKAGQRIEHRVTVPVDASGVVHAVVTADTGQSGMRVQLVDVTSGNLLAERRGIGSVNVAADVSALSQGGDGPAVAVIVDAMDRDVSGNILVQWPGGRPPQVDRAGGDPDKGIRKTSRPRDLAKKGESSTQRRLPGPEKTAPDAEPSPTPVRAGLKQTDLRVDPATEKQPIKDPRPKPGFRYGVVRLQILEGKLTVASTYILDGPLVTSDEVTGDVLYEAVAHGRTFAVGTTPDPRIRRVHLEDGSRREAILDGIPAWFKVELPEDALNEDALHDMVIRIYRIPGELGLEQVNLKTLPSIKKDLELLGTTAPGMIAEALTR